MKKFVIGFGVGEKEEQYNEKITMMAEPETNARKSVVQVYFPKISRSYAYYNDKFDLKEGDMVYVDGKLEGYRGFVTEVNYTFKIKLSDYKRVIAVADTKIKGDFYIAESHMVSFDRNSIPFGKVVTWLKGPEDGEYETGSDDENGFMLEDLSGMKIGKETADKGFDCYKNGGVIYISVDKNHGYAIVEGSKPYEIEFDYYDGEISNIICSCFCSGACKHEFAAMLQLRETLDFITEHYTGDYDDYFAAIDKGVFESMVNNRTTGKITVG